MVMSVTQLPRQPVTIILAHRPSASKIIANYQQQTQCSMNQCSINPCHAHVQCMSMPMSNIHIDINIKFTSQEPSPTPSCPAGAMRSHMRGCGKKLLGGGGGHVRNPQYLLASRASVSSFRGQGQGQGQGCPRVSSFTFKLQDGGTRGKGRWGRWQGTRDGEGSLGRRRRGKRRKTHTEGKKNGMTKTNGAVQQGRTSTRRRIQIQIKIT
jgi:hypothetical protein